MRSSPSTTKRMSLSTRARLRASAVRTRSSSSSSAIRIVIELRSARGLGDCMGLVLVDRLGEQVCRRLAVRRLLDRQSNREARATAELALRGDRPVMALDDLAAQGEADAGAGVG